MAVCRLLHECAQPALFSGPTPSFPSLESEAGTWRWGDILSWQGTFGPGTTCLGGQLVLGPHVRGDSWSGGTRGPPTPFHTGTWAWAGHETKEHIRMVLYDIMQLTLLYENTFCPSK